MTISELNALSTDDLLRDFDTYISGLIVEDTGRQEKVDKWIKEYDMKHTIFDRLDKSIGEGDTARLVEVAKLGVPFQKKIVKSAASFLFGEPVNIIKNNEDVRFDQLYINFMKAYRQAKLDYHNRKLARRLFVETQVAELLYIRAYSPDLPPETDEANPEQATLNITSKITEKKLKIMLLCKKNGDSIYPVWDSLGDMTGFIRKYEHEIYEEGEKKKVERVEIYTAKYNYICTKGDSWVVQRVENVFGKIPVIYYEQESAEWEDVQTLIDRIEMMISKNSDTNDYFGSPAIVAKGELKSAPDKDEVGKFFEIEPTISEGKATFGDLSYLTWDMAPEAIKMEYEMLKDLVYSMTETPDLSFNNIKGTSNLSGIALKFMFFDSILKAKQKQEIFGEALERRNNLIKSMLAKADLAGNKGIEELDLSVEFMEALPENIKEIIEMLSVAIGGEPTMSRETAVKNNPFVSNPENEIIELEKEDQKKNTMNESYV